MFGKYNLLTLEQASLFHIKASEKEVMIRPEEFRLSAASDSGIKGTIRKISFWGGFYEAEVLVKDFVIVVRSSEAEWQVGQQVFIGVIRNKSYYRERQT
jgi:iron(III) transport system ATP-binding protein